MQTEKGVIYRNSDGTQKNLETELGLKANTTGTYPNLSVGKATQDGSGNTITTTYATKTELLSKVFPVGAIYMSTSSTSPASLFGGSWTRIQDQFLLAGGTSYAAGSTGGEASHTLTVSEMPAHDHEENGEMLGYVENATWGNELTGNGKVKTYTYFRTSQTGGGQPHNNMPPYLAVYVWKRTA